MGVAGSVGVGRGVKKCKFMCLPYVMGRNWKEFHRNKYIFCILVRLGVRKHRKVSKEPGNPPQELGKSRKVLIKYRKIPIKSQKVTINSHKGPKRKSSIKQWPKSPGKYTISRQVRANIRLVEKSPKNLAKRPQKFVSSPEKSLKSLLISANSRNFEKLQSGIFIIIFTLLDQKRNFIS